MTTAIWEAIKDGSAITGRRISPFGGKGAKPLFYSTGPAAAALAAKEPPVQPGKSKL